MRESISISTLSRSPLSPLGPGLAVSLALIALAGALAGCGDDGGGGAPDAAMIDANQGCRSSIECMLDLGCVGPSDTNCGIPPQQQCAGDGDCGGGGNVCHAIADSCSPRGIGSMCGAACTPGDACGDGFVCDAQGACRPIPCDDPAYACRAAETCDPGSIDPAGAVYDITHGCTSIACADDGPCPGTSVCVNSYCQDGLGTCMPPAP